jgi:hypothetical protein
MRSQSLSICLVVRGRAKPSCRACKAVSKRWVKRSEIPCSLPARHSEKQYSRTSSASVSTTRWMANASPLAVVSDVAAVASNWRWRSRLTTR